MLPGGLLSPVAVVLYLAGMSTYALKLRGTKRKRSREDTTRGGHRPAAALGALGCEVEVTVEYEKSTNTMTRPRPGRSPVELAVYRWRQLASSQRKKGVVVLLHGLNGHAEFGSNIGTAHHLLNGGYDVVAMDLEGHGRSGGTPGLVPLIEHLVGDVVALLKQTRQDNPGMQVFLMGNSMGGLTATLTALAVQDSGQELLSGVVLQCPLVQFSHPPSPLLVAICSLLAGIAPHMPLFSHSPGKGTTQAVASRVRAAMQADAYCYTGPVRVGTAVALHRAAAKAAARIGEIRIPFLVQHGDEDPLVALAGSVQLHSQAVAADKRMEVYANAGHNLLNEKEAVLHRVRSDYLSWLDARADASYMSSQL
jgi:acylglycerol lipase